MSFYFDTDGKVYRFSTHNTCISDFDMDTIHIGSQPSRPQERVQPGLWLNALAVHLHPLNLQFFIFRHESIYQVVGKAFWYGYLHFKGKNAVFCKMTVYTKLFSPSLEVKQTY